MALVGHISGSSQSNSVIGVSGSVIIANRSSALFPALPGTDVSFFVSGSAASDMALFGGGLVSSGSLTVKNASGGNSFTVASATGNTVVQGTLQSVGAFTATGGLTATSITGSITKLAGDGGDFLRAGSNITLTTGSLGEVTIAASAGGTPGGSDTQVQFNNDGAFAGDADLTYNSTSNTLTGVTGSFYRVVATDEVRANGGSVTTTQTTFNLVNTTATTLNVGGAATAITMGDVTSATTTIRGGTLVGNLTTQNLFNTTATTLNIGGAATTVEIGAATGTTSVNNALTVDGNVTLGDASGDTVTVNGTTTFAGAAVTTTLAGSGSIAGTLTVAGSTTLNGAVTVGDASADTVTVNGTTTFAGAAVTTTLAGSGSIAGALTVGGDTTLNGNTTLGNDISDTVTFTARSASNFLPSADVTYDLGSSARRWANIYTGDLHLKNERGDYTLIEEPDFLTIRFNATGKRYKFMLEAVPELDEELGNFSSGPKG